MAILGVHLNLCMMGRPYGIRNMVYQGQNVVLVRDLTDALYNPRMPPQVSHHRGTELTVEHIEKYWCPSITSDQVLGGRPFRFRDQASEGTWQAAMSALCRKLPDRQARKGASGFEPFASDMIRGGKPARHVRLCVRGVEQLSLISEGTPEHPAAHCDWADAKLIAEDGTVTYLSDLEPVLVDQPYGSMRRDRNHRNGPLKIGGKTFERGLGTHAYSEIRFTLDGKYAWFEAWVGIDAVAGGNGSCRFTVTDESPAVLRQATEQCWQAIIRDFSNPVSRRQIAWEQEDRLWDRYEDDRGIPDPEMNLQWTRKNHLWHGAADPNTMAQRLVKACYRVPELQQRARQLAAGDVDRATLGKLRQIYYRSRVLNDVYESGGRRREQIVTDFSRGVYRR